jgi:hypothetical protein
LERAVQHETGPVELILCPFCVWRYAGIAGGRRHHEVLEEHLEHAHRDVPATERARRTREQERAGRLLTPFLPLQST